MLYLLTLITVLFTNDCIDYLLSIHFIWIGLCMMLGFSVLLFDILTLLSSQITDLSQI